MEHIQKAKSMCHSLQKSEKKVIDNKKFWKSVKPLFSNKIKTKDNLRLIEDGITITNECELANNFNNLTTISSIL